MTSINAEHADIKTTAQDLRGWAIRNSFVSDDIVWSYVATTEAPRSPDWNYRDYSMSWDGKIAYHGGCDANQVRFMEWIAEGHDEHVVGIRPVEGNPNDCLFFDFKPVLQDDLILTIGIKASVLKSDQHQAARDLLARRHRDIMKDVELKKEREWMRRVPKLLKSRARNLAKSHKEKAQKFAERRSDLTPDMLFKAFCIECENDNMSEPERYQFDNWVNKA